MNATQTTIEVIADLETLAEITAACRDKSNFENISERAAVLAIWPLASVTASRANDGCFRGRTVYGAYIPALGLTVAANCLTPRHAWKAALNHARYRGLAPAFPAGEVRDLHPSACK